MSTSLINLLEIWWVMEMLKEMHQSTNGLFNGHHNEQSYKARNESETNSDEAINEFISCCVLIEKV